MRMKPVFMSGVMAAILVVAANAPLAADNPAPPVDFSADSLEHDDATNTVTARGNVVLEQAGRILKADEVSYNVTNDAVSAQGNVVLLESNGDVYFADEVAFTDQMREGYVAAVKATLRDGSRLWAESGQRSDGSTTTMEKAGYTACEACESDPQATPPWQIVAGKVTHDQEEKRVSYRNARMELWGVPVLYTPYFAHADGTVKQKSGFLAPSAGYDSDLGFMLTNSYYMALSPHYDATLGVTMMTQQGPLLSGEYRHRFENARLEASGSITYAQRTDSESGEDIRQDEELRGHLFADGLWDINDKWRAGMMLEIASDDQYMRQYDFSGKDVLENAVFIERFSGRNYAVGRILAFQDVRILEEQTDQPDIFPELQAGFLGDPGKTLGGRWSLDLNMMNLRREADGQDMSRVVAAAGWHRRLVSDTGLLATVDLTLRGDAFHTRDRDVTVADPGRDDNGSQVRGFAQAHVTASYPVVKPLEKADVIVEPIVAVTAAPSVNAASDNIPNEDSQDIQLDTGSLFSADRFSGLDRIEDKSRATYGVRTGVYGHGGSKGEVFVGQSYRFDSGDDINPFPQGSGLSDQKSDLVGQITAAYKNRYTIDYRFQLDSDTMASRRHEVEARANMGRVQVAARYLYAQSIEGTNRDETREQIQAGISYDVTDEWRVRTSATRDMGFDPGLRRAEFGIDYTGQCLSLSGELQRKLSRDSSGDSGTQVMFRIGLRNIGEFETSEISLDRDEGSSTPPPPAAAATTP